MKQLIFLQALFISDVHAASTRIILSGLELKIVFVLFTMWKTRRVIRIDDVYLPSNDCFQMEE